VGGAHLAARTFSKAAARPFHEPIPLPRGRQLVTVDEDAGNYITKLSKAEHTAAKWQ